MKDEDTNRKEAGTHLTWKKCIVGNEDIGLIRVRLLQSGDRSKSIKCERNHQEGRLSKTQFIGSDDYRIHSLSSFLSLRKKKQKTIVMPRNGEIFSSCTDYKDFCIKYKHHEGTCLIRASAFK